MLSCPNYTVKKVSRFPVPSRDVTNQSPGRVWLVTFRLTTGKWLTFSYSVPEFFRGSYRRSACCRYFDPFTIGSSVKDKHHLHLRHLASYLVYGSEGVVRAKRGDWDIRTQYTNRGASGRDT